LTWGRSRQKPDSLFLPAKEAFYYSIIRSIDDSWSTLPKDFAFRPIRSIGCHSNIQRGIRDQLIQSDFSNFILMLLSEGRNCTPMRYGYTGTTLYVSVKPTSNSITGENNNVAICCVRGAQSSVSVPGVRGEPQGSARLFLRGYFIARTSVE